jgi:ABC-type Fe3+-hydroxamate transport system substrate-binding protein
MKRSIRTCILSVAILIIGLFFGVHAGAAPEKLPEKINVVMVGDRVVDIAYNLGFVPSAMSVRCSLWPMCDNLKEASQVLGCPACIVAKNPKALPDYLKKTNIKRVIIEKSEKFCLYMPNVNPIKSVKLIKDMDVEIQYVDFSDGLESAVLQTARLLGVEKKAQPLINKYNSNLEKIKGLIPEKDPSTKVIILNGVYQAATDKIFIRIEAPGGYSDKYILEPLGCINVGGTFMEEGTNVTKGHFNIRKLNSLVKVNPDVIAMTGDAYAVQRALSEYVRSNPEMSDITAVREAAIFALPLYVDAGILEYPDIFRKWAAALARQYNTYHK